MAGNSGAKRNWAKTIIISILTILFYLLFVVLMFFAVTGHSLADWYRQTFHTRIREIIYTFNLGLKGADASFMTKAVAYCKVELIIFALLLIIVIAFEIHMHTKIKRARDGVNNVGSGEADSDWAGKEKKFRRIRMIVRALAFVICLAGACSTYVYADKVLEFNDFIKSRLMNTKLYEKKYTDPDKVKISLNSQQKGKKRNLIMVYVESMENTYASKDLGGAQKVNLIPNLTQLQKENIGFGDQKKGYVRGSYNPYGTTWTTGAILSTSAGIPFNFHIGQNQMGKEDAFAPGATAIGDILKTEGYTQEFMCGSDAEFGGRKKFFKDHGNYNIFDYYTAIKKGYIDKDYHVWWGLEDHILFEMARDELTRLSGKDEPFNFTVLTVDTHNVAGYKCKWCPNKYKSKTANVVECCDKQVSDFVRWCKQQPFYDDTTIVVVGDHPRMDTRLVSYADQEKRVSYNCFINPAPSAISDTKTNRLAVSMDIFPTTLAAMGYNIEGNRLGLGTNLFSNRKSISDEMTYKEFADELGKNSDYYQNTFTKEK